MSLLREFLTYAIKHESSDVHLKTNRPPAFRVHGVLRSVGSQVCSLDEMNAIVKDLIPDYAMEKYNRDHEVDLSHFEPEVGRFRVNVFFSGGVPTIAH